MFKDLKYLDDELKIKFKRAAKLSEKSVNNMTFYTAYLCSDYFIASQFEGVMQLEKTFTEKEMEYINRT